MISLPICRCVAAAVFAIMLTVSISCAAQNAPAPAASTATSTAVAPASAGSAGPPSQAGPAGLTVDIPRRYEFKLSGLPEPVPPSSGPGWWGSVVVAAIVAAIASVFSSMKTAAISAEARQSLETQLQAERHEHEREMSSRTEAFQKELHAATQSHKTGSDQATLSREDRKIDNEVARLRQAALSASLELEVTAIRLVRERESEAAKLIHMYLPQLSGASERDRQIALFALSGYVDAEALQKVLDGRESEAAWPFPPAGGHADE